MNINLYLAYLSISFFTIISPRAAILLAINHGLYYDMKAVFLSKTAKTWFLKEITLRLFYKISGFLFILMGIGILFF